MKKEVILIVDDEQNYLDTITDTLEERNFKIIQALNGKMGIMVAQKFLPDIIITDWEMPEMNGIEMIQQLKANEQTANIPVIMCTGIMTTSQNLHVALGAGAYDYIRKPIDPIELVARINATLRLSNSYKKIHQQAEKLAESNATKDKFFSIIAHDLKNPFTSILGFSNLILGNKSKFSEEDIINFVTQISDSAKNTFKLLENLLTWSRSQTGKLEYYPIVLNINNIVCNSKSLIQYIAQGKNITIEFDVEKNIEVFADENMINTVIRNLLSNAVKYTHKGGKIVLKAVSQNNQLLIEISDNGVGIPPQKIEKLFKISEKVSTLGTENEAGTGLGLLLCKEFVEKNGGKIWVESTQNIGSKFFFTLPLATDNNKTKFDSTAFVNPKLS